MGYVGHREIRRPDGSTRDAWCTYCCGHCGTKVSGAVVARHEGTEWLLCPNCGEGSVLDQRGNVHPGVAFGPHIEGLPASTAKAYEEARRCLSVAAYTGSELVCRKILMHVAVDKGAGEGEPFASYLDYLEAQGYVTPPMRSWVRMIRTHGNKAAHLLEESDQARAESTLMFTAELLRIIYEMEHMAERYGTEAEESGSVG